LIRAVLAAAALELDDPAPIPGKKEENQNTVWNFITIEDTGQKFQG
jgi:hypothetical protein